MQNSFLALTTVKFRFWRNLAKNHKLISIWSSCNAYADWIPRRSLTSHRPWNKWINMQGKTNNHFSWNVFFLYERNCIKYAIKLLWLEVSFRPLFIWKRYTWLSKLVKTSFWKDSYDIFFCKLKIIIWMKINLIYDMTPMIGEAYTTSWKDICMAMCFLLNVYP